jgi:hypothetical protein
MLHAILDFKLLLLGECPDRDLAPALLLNLSVELAPLARSVHPIDENAAALSGPGVDDTHLHP